MVSKSGIRNVSCFQISQNEREAIKEYLEMSSLQVNDVDSMQFYKVPFSQASNLVKKRKVLIIQGTAFVPENVMGFVLATYFKRILISAFEVSVDEFASLFTITIVSYPVIIF